MNVAAVPRKPNIQSVWSPACAGEDLQVRNNPGTYVIQIKLSLESQTLFSHRVEIRALCHDPFTDVLLLIMEKPEVMEIKFLTPPDKICDTPTLYIIYIVPGITSYRAVFFFFPYTFPNLY